MSNRVMHFEIPYEDVDRARGFYHDVFGWAMQPMPEMDYTLVMTGPVDDQGGPTEPGYVNGGMFKREGPFGPAMVVVDVEDIDKTLETVGAHGGSTVVDKRPVGDMGFVAYVKDSEDNLVGLWQNA